LIREKGIDYEDDDEDDEADQNGFDK